VAPVERIALSENLPVPTLEASAQAPSTHAAVFAAPEASPQPDTGFSGRASEGIVSRGAEALRSASVMYLGFYVGALANLAEIEDSSRRCREPLWH